MAWVQVESSVSRNKKFIAAGPAPAWLWLCGLAYCQEGLTDGFIPTEALDFLGVKNPKALVERLVKARLWDAVPGGWKVHDYLEHNKSREQIQDTSKRRGDGGKLGGRPPKKTSHETVEGNLQGFHGGNHTGNPASSFPASSGTAPSSREDARPPARRAPLHDTTHKSHAHCGRICLHSSLFGEFVRRRGHADADREVRDWALQVDREWSDGGAKAHLEPGDSFDFWRARYAERWPVAVQAQSTLRPSTAGTLAAAAEIMRGES